jgi:septal ring factor EnvC (AmiA/AmiB activator)
MFLSSGRSVWLTCACTAALGILAASGETLAQGQNVASAATQSVPGASAETAEEKTRRETELRQLEEALAASSESRRRLEAELGELKGDTARFNAELIETAERARAAEERMRAVEQRLQTLTASETGIRRSLAARRGVIGEVLGALQRMGRRPPPAVLVRPEDMLAALRTAMLLGTVVPDLRAETDMLATDLAELVRLKAAIVADRETFRRELADLLLEQERLDVLTAARQERMAEAQQTFASERERAAGLAAQARSLKELIDGMERDLGATKRASEDAKRVAEGQTHEARERFAAAAFGDPARLAPKVPFSEARGLLPRPVSGRTLRDFGVDDGYGGTTRGISITTRPRAVVTSPADGWVAFAGPFRSFGRLLIINAGGGYYLLLAGTDHISVEVGQFVLAGEPVATMGEVSSLSPAAGSIETNDPVLYVEFRKDGGSIDPSPWWAKSQGEKVRG